LEVLEIIRKEGSKRIKGKEGMNLKLVWGMDAIAVGWNRVVEWIPVVRERVEAESVRQQLVRDGEMFDGEEGVYA